MIKNKYYYSFHCAMFTIMTYYARYAYIIETYQKHDMVKTQ